MSDAPGDVQELMPAPIPSFAAPVSQPAVSEVEMTDDAPETMPTKIAPVFDMNLSIWAAKPSGPAVSQATTKEVVMDNATSPSTSNWDLKPPRKPASVISRLSPKPKTNTKNEVASSRWADSSDDGVKKPASKEVDMGAEASSKEPTKSDVAATPPFGGAKVKKSTFGRPQTKMKKQDVNAEEMMKAFRSDFSMGGVKLFPLTKQKPSTILVPASQTKENVGAAPIPELDFNTAPTPNTSAAAPTQVQFPNVKDQAAVDKCLVGLKDLHRAQEAAAQAKKPTKVEQKKLPEFNSFLPPPPKPGPPAEPSKRKTDDAAAVVSVPESPGKPRKFAKPKLKLDARGAGAVKGAASAPVGGDGGGATAPSTSTVAAAARGVGASLPIRCPNTAIDANSPSTRTAFTNPFSTLRPSPFSSAAAATTAPTTTAGAAYGGVRASLSLRGPYTAIDAGMPSSGAAFTNPISNLRPSPFSSAAPTTTATATGGVQNNASKSVFSNVKKYTLPKNFTFVAGNSDSESDDDDDDSDGSYEDVFGPKPPASDDKDEESDQTLTALRAKARARPAAIKKDKPRAMKQLGKKWAKKAGTEKVVGDSAGDVKMTPQEADREVERLLLREDGVVSVEVEVIKGGDGGGGGGGNDDGDQSAADRK